MSKLKIHFDETSVMELDGGTNDPKQKKDWMNKLASTGFATASSGNGTIILFNFKHVTFIEYEPDQNSTVNASDEQEVAE